MCGIAGIINFNNKAVDESLIRIMMATMKHRGPDDDGTYIDNNIGFGFVRLSILDLSLNGHQPMFDKTNRFMIIHNGEVYNYIELREKLIKKGYSFGSNTDTEVILYSFIEWGEDCVTMFNGMWSFCIYDSHKKQLFISRDRFGIKPFYYYQNDNIFIFASEIKPIVNTIKTYKYDQFISPNYQIIFDYFVFNRTDHTNETFFVGINKLQHGHNLLVNTQSLQLEKLNTGWNSLNGSQSIFIKKWYDLRLRIKQAKPITKADEFKELFFSSIQNRLRSDVPVGVCLSGGLDSSSILSMLIKKFNRSDTHTFSAVYGAGIYGDESEYISEYSGIINNMHMAYPTATTLYSDLNKFISIFSEPIPDTSPYAQYKVMELAKEHAVVLLNGQGADEILGGYHYFFGFYYKELLRKLQLKKLSIEMFYYFLKHSSMVGMQSFIYFLLPSSLQIQLKVNKYPYFNHDFIKLYKSNNNVVDNIYSSKTLQDALLDHMDYKLEHLLKWDDLNSMNFSLESRVPFLDYRLVERTIASNTDNFINTGTTKSLLRRAMQDILPTKINNRQDKIGFSTPASTWFRSKIFTELFKKELINDKFLETIVDMKSMKKIILSHQTNQNDHSSFLWKTLNLKFWHDEYFNN